LVIKGDVMAQSVSGSRRQWFRVPEMEGTLAHWYAKQRGGDYQLAQYRREASRATEDLPGGSAVLEIAPGPGYFAIEVARSGRYRVSGLDISHTMVQIATENAARAGVEVDFQRGDASALPFGDESFDLIMCQAAFKNFREPLLAVNEMHRVLRPGGVAEIQDLSREATTAEIDREVAGMGLTGPNAFITKVTLATMLRRRAYTTAQFRRLAANSAFGGAQLHRAGIGVTVRLTKPAKD
jgi:ubiquinone/menaquinone biosynthesis C-methylase UbiE